MNDTLFNVINDSSQCRVAICVEHIKPDWNIFRQTLKKLQVEHQTRIFVVTILMHLCLRTYAGNAYEIEVAHSPTLDIRHEINDSRKTNESTYLSL